MRDHQDNWPVWAADQDAREDAARYYADLDAYEREKASADDYYPEDRLPHPKDLP